LNAIGINTPKTVKVLECIESLPSTRQDILLQLGLSNHYKNYDAYISPLREQGFLAYTIPDNTKSRKQQYKITLKGLILLKILEVQLPDESE
jgi:predicted transcriptional regulator